MNFGRFVGFTNKFISKFISKFIKGMREEADIGVVDTGVDKGYVFKAHVSKGVCF